MLIPLIWFFVWLGSSLGMSKDYATDKWVYLADYYAEGNPSIYATACDPGIYSKLCKDADAPNDTIVLYPSAWRSDIITQQHVVRHEIEHMLRSPDVSTFDEQDVERATCEVIPHWWCY